MFGYVESVSLPANDVEERHRRSRAVLAFAIAAATGDVERFLAALDGLDWPSAWVDAFEEVSRMPPEGMIQADVQAAFACAWQSERYWGSNPPHGLHWAQRHALSARGDILTAGLRRLMPRFRDTLPAVLYRGSSAAEHVSGCYGFWWTTVPGYAEWYARSSIRAYAGQRVVIAALNPGPAIIAMLRDGIEFLVDASALDQIHLVACPEPYTATEDDGDWQAVSVLNDIPHGYDVEAVASWKAGLGALRPEAA